MCAWARLPYKGWLGGSGPLLAHMPSPAPPDRVLPRDLSPSLEVRACSSPLELKAGTGQHNRLPPRLAWCAIDWAQLRLEEPLGAGGFGRVYRATYHGQTVAAKKVTRGGKNRLAQRQSFWAELNAAPLPRHPNLLRLLAASACPPPEEPLCLGVVLLEYAAGGTLHRAIYSAPAEELCARRCLGYARDLARGLGFLHAHSLVHLDLKPANVLLAPGLPGPGPPRYTCKIGDFGSSQRLQREPAPPAHTGGGTYTHRAPELLRGLPASRRADIYSFAVTLWQMLSRQHPYVGRERHSVLYAVVAQGLRPELTAAAFCPPAPGARFTGLIRRCWSPQPEQRPAARSLLQELEIMPDSESSRPLAQWNMTLPPATVATEL